MYLSRLLTIALGTVLLAVVTGCGIAPGTTVTGSGIPETRSFALSGFTGIQAAAAFAVRASRADSYSVQITADNNLWDSLDIRVSGNALYLRTRPGASIRNSTLGAAITCPAISNVSLSGAARCTLSGFNSNSNTVFNLSGASTAEFENVRCGNTTFDLSGASGVTGRITTADCKFTMSGASTAGLSGAGSTASIDASGASQANLSQFLLQTATITLSGASLAMVNCQKITSADLTGGSMCYYADSPTMGNIKTSGGSGMMRR